MHHMKRSPAYAHYKAHTFTPPTPATELGTAFHYLLLEPHTFRDRYAMQPGPTSAYLKHCADKKLKSTQGWTRSPLYTEEISTPQYVGRELLKPFDWERVHAMRDAALSHELGEVIAREVEAGNAIIEASVMAHDTEHDVPRKCRPDCLLPARGMAIDLKSTRAVNPQGFSFECHKYSYHMTAAWYLDTLNWLPNGTHYEHYAFLATQSDAPFEPRGYVMGQFSIERGRMEYQYHLKRWAQCKRDGVWPAGPNTIEEIDLPEWAFNREIGDE